MKLFKSIVTQRKKKGDKITCNEDVKSRPILLVALNVKDAQQQLGIYWGRKDYRWTRPNMIADFNPR